MKYKNLKLIPVTLAAVILAFIFYIVLPGFTTEGSPAYDFTRGMLTGLSSVAAFVWLFSLLKIVVEADKSGGIISFIKNNNQIILNIAIFCFLAGMIIRSAFPDNSKLYIPSIILIGISIFLNGFYMAKTFIKGLNIR